MPGETIASRALGDAGPRALPTELDGPRPAGVRDAERATAAEARTALATKP